jgi:hypothetical protein
MKNKLLLSAVFLLLLVGLYTPASFSQYSFKCNIANAVQIADSLTFDLFIGNTGQPLTLYSFQVGLTYRVSGCNGQTGLGSAVWTNFAPAVTAAGMNNTAPNVTTAGVVKCAAKISPGGPGTGVVIPAWDTVTMGMRWGTLTVRNKAGVAFTTDISTSLQMTWCFVTAQYPTKMQSAFQLDGTTPLVTDITTSGMYMYRADGIGVLPVELSSFQSNVSGRQVVLNWETKTEINTSKFEIDRALVSTKDASLVWTSVGNIQAAGNSNAPKKYSYTEKNLQTGKYQYRLKMIDNDGSYKYSDIVETVIGVPKDFALSQNYPNPFNPTTKIDYQVPVDAKVIMEVYSLTGQKVVELVNQDQQAGYYSANFGASKLASGVYIYRLVATEKATGNNFSSIKKMMLLK